MDANPVVYLIRRVRRSGNLDLAPLLVRRHKFPFRRESLEFFVNTLLLDTAFTLDEWGL